MYSRYSVVTILFLVSIFFIFSSGGYQSAEVATNAHLSNGGCNCHGMAQLDTNILKIHVEDLQGNPVTEYSAGDTFKVNIILDKQNQASNARAGFQATVCHPASQTYPGDYLNMMPAQTHGQITTGGGKKYVGHNTSLVGSIMDANLDVTWSFAWIAPSTTGNGPVTIYAVGNDANGNGNSIGDDMYRNNIQLNEKVVTSTSEIIRPKGLRVFPNPCGQVFNIDVDDNLSEEARVTIHSLNGRVVRTAQLLHDKNRIQLDDHIGTGLYFVQVRDGEKVYTEKIFKK